MPLRFEQCPDRGPLRPAANSRGPHECRGRVSRARATKSKTREPRRPSRGRADLPQLRKATDAEIRRTSPAELTDLPATFWDEAEVVAPSPKRAVSIRVDEDVLDWFRGSGPRYQTRMNAVLRMYVKRMRKHS